MSKQGNKGRSKSNVGSKKSSRQNSKQVQVRKNLPTKTPRIGKTQQVTIQKPQYQSLANGNIVVRHREYLGKIAGATGFSVLSKAINPGLSTSFGWLYGLANRYESYRVKRMVYHYVPSKTGTFAGTIILGIDYDASDASPFGEDELQTYWGAKTSVITEPLSLVASVQAMHKIGPSKFVRMGSLDADQDIKLYDVGNFFYAVDGCADTSSIGRIFVDYEIELQTPQSDPSAIVSGVYSFTSESAAAPLGTAIVSSGPLGLTWVSGTTFKVNTPGQYLFYWNVTTATTLTACTKIASNTGNSTFEILNSEILNGAATAGVAVQRVKVSSSEDVFTVGVTAASLTNNNLRIAAYRYANA